MNHLGRCNRLASLAAFAEMELPHWKTTNSHTRPSEHGSEHRIANSKQAHLVEKVHEIGHIGIVAVRPLLKLGELNDVVVVGVRLLQNARRHHIREHLPNQQSP